MYSTDSALFSQALTEGVARCTLEGVDSDGSIFFRDVL